MKKYTLVFDIKSDWHIGCGKEGGAYADALTLKDTNRLPYIPGKSIKGLLRDAFQTAADCSWFGTNSDTVVSYLFGEEDREGTIKQGMIQVSSAMLSTDETEFLTSHSSGKNVADHLYRVIQSTAIDQKNGVAKHTSLRSIEVTVPMTLSAEISLNTSHHSFEKNPDIQVDFGQWLTDTVTLITELGNKRHRGLGQVTVSVKEA